MTETSDSELVSTRQRRIAQLAKQMPEKGLTSLNQHLDVAWLREAFRRTRKDGAAGVDGQTAADYEPKPGRRGGFARIQHRYQSCGLRFEVKRPQESLDEFRQRINRAARDDDEEYAGAVGDTKGWILGPNLRTRGSIHSDWWRGTAADLAACGHIAVFPVSGWWREKTDQDYWARHARYSLVVSIRTEATTVDLYSPVQIMLQVPVEQPLVAEIEVEDV